LDFVIFEELLKNWDVPSNKSVLEILFELENKILGDNLWLLKFDYYRFANKNVLACDYLM